MELSSFDRDACISHPDVGKEILASGTNEDGSIVEFNHEKDFYELISNKE